jgi:hypothetical protein
MVVFLPVILGKRHFYAIISTLYFPVILVNYFSWVTRNEWNKPQIDVLGKRQIFLAYLPKQCQNAN